jgi:putative nucleotidyltransferase with HDIG domain
MLDLEQVTVARLSATIDARDGYTAAHSKRVRHLAVTIGKELGLPPGELAALGHAALLHDIGKASIPDEILLKPAGLDATEWRLMRHHSIEGARMIDALGLFAGSVPAIRHHHERYDGTGYPDGLAGEEIPIGARIIHLADAVDSMLSHRVYRRGRPGRLVLAEIRREVGRQFCPDCVRSFERLVGAGALAELGLPASIVLELA